MSYVFIKKHLLVSACERCIEWAEADKLKAFDTATREARIVWWRKLLGLKPLTVQQAKDRLVASYNNEMFGGVLGSIEHTYRWNLQLPEKLLAACNVATEDEIMLSVEHAEVINNWESK